MKKNLLSLLFLLIFSALGATQSTPLVLTQFPAAIVHPDSQVTIKWTGANLETASIYFSRKPGGSNIDNYTGKISLPNVDFSSGKLPQKGIQFTPSSIASMGTGIFYLTVASSKTNYSNEIKFIVKSSAAVQMIAPIGSKTTNVTPTFRWTPIPDVPYYHVIVTDEKITTDANNKVSGLSIIWQAITSSDGITYGAPDPSGTITATPPPLSAGVNYSWFVLNNYGNNAALSAYDMKLPGSFGLAVDSLKTPKLIGPEDSATLSYTEYSSANPIKLTWTNLDPRANSYKVYLYATSENSSLSSKTVLWDGEVTAKSFAGKDTGSITVDATNILTTNQYTWKVIAIDETGKGQTSKGQTFSYKGKSGKIYLRVKEKIAIKDTTITQGVGLAEIKTEVIDGSMEKPLMFFTDNNGYLVRSRPVGTYRLTAVKDGYTPTTRTITLEEGKTDTIDIYLERPDGSVRGVVADGNKTPVNIAKVVAISTFGDTTSTETDPAGNFVVNCGKGDWDISASKDGYVSPLPKRVTVDNGKSIALDSVITLQKNSLILSGTVTNSNGAPITAAKVTLKNEFNTIVGEIPSTSSDGTYKFSVNAGTYILSVSKTGFTSFNETFQFASSTVKDIQLSAGASQIKGSIYGKSWSYEGLPTTAAIRNLQILAIDETGDTVASSITDVWGNFTLGVAGDNKRYTLKYSAQGYAPGNSVTGVIKPGATVEFSDTVEALANLYSYISYNGKPAAGILFSVIDSKKKVTVASGKSAEDGSVEIYGIPDGTYRLKAASKQLFANKFTQKLFSGATVDDTVITIVNGRIIDNSKPVQRILVTVEEGQASVLWVVKKPVSDTAKATINIIDPLLLKLTEGDILDSIGLEEYRIEVNAVAPKIIDCAQHLTNVETNGDTTLDTITLPFWHISAQSIEISKNSTIDLTLETDPSLFSGKITSAEIYYRPFGATAFLRDTVKTINSSNTCLFTLKDIPTGNWLEYYFRIIKDGSDVFGSAKEVYRTFIKPSASVLSKLEVVPVVDTKGYTIASGGSINLEVRGYYGDKFDTLGVIPGSYITWSGTGVTISPREDSAKASVTGESIGTGSITVSFSGNKDGYVLGTGVDSIFTFPVTIADQLASIKIQRISTHENGFALNNEKSQFAVKALDKSGKSVMVSPLWECAPTSAGKITDKGEFTPAPGFTGRVQIIATITDAIRDIYMDPALEGKQAQTGMLVGYSIQPENDSVDLFDGNELSIVVPESSVVSGTALITVDNPVYENKVYKTIPVDGVSLISKVFQIQRRSAANFSTDSITIKGSSEKVTRSSLVEATIAVPQQYRQFMDDNGSRFTLGVWNPDSLVWQNVWQKKSAARAGTDADTLDTLPTILNNVKWNAIKGGWTIPVGDQLNTKENIQLALLFNESDNVEGDFQVSPNPFSPYVSPIRDYPFVDGMNENVKGTCLKIIPMNSTSRNNPDVTVNIYTANRTLVWETRLYSVIPGREYFLFWDGKTLIGRSENGDAIKSVENKVIAPQGNEMCRNGRYFAVVTIDDGNKKKRFTKEIILFK